VNVGYDCVYTILGTDVVQASRIKEGISNAFFIFDLILAQYYSLYQI